jgi:peptidoglycan/LPS O-acetylase OafA/YrhL
MPHKPSSVTYFDNFDALRFISAFAVLLFHKFNNFDWKFFDEYPLIYKTLNFISRNGFIGVNFFFVLSGFLITYLIIKEIDKHNEFNFRNFIVRRILRIWPVYFILVAISYIHKGNSDGIEYYLSFLSNIEVIYRNTEQTGIQFPLWSVSIEEQYYLVIPAIIFFFKIRTKQGFLWLYSILILISSIYQGINYSNVNKLHYATLSCITDLSIGGIYAVMAFHSHRFVNSFKELSKSLILFIYTLGSTYIIVRVYLHHIAVFKTSDHFIMALFFGFTLMEQTYSKNSFFKFKQFKILSKLGTYTYGLYLYHMVVFIFIHNVWSHFKLIDNIFIDTFLKLVVSSLLSILVCYISYKYIETPFLNFKKRFN